MGKNAAKSIRDALEMWGSLAAAEGLLVPEKRLESGAWTGFETPVDSHLVPDPILNGKKAYLDGNLARRNLPIADGDDVIWDTDLPGFGLRLRPSGRHTWFVRIRHRDKHKRFHLGRVEDVDAVTARTQARRMLAEVALDGLPQPLAQKLAPLFSNYVEEFWRDYAHHWKPSTQLRNRNAVRNDILPHFGGMRLDAIARPDIARWRDACAEGKEARFNRALPVLAAMLHYAEQLGHIRKSSNPCRGTSRFKRKPMERFLSPQEYRRLGRCLSEAKEESPAQVAIMRLLIYTGARKEEIASLRWDWVQLPRLLLPHSKTGAKTIWLCKQAAEILESQPRHAGVPYVFPNSRGDSSISVDPWWYKFRRHCALPDLRIHDLRHSYASIAIRHNVALATVGKLLGHELPETTAKYAHLADDTIADAASRVSGGLARAIGLGA